MTKCFKSPDALSDTDTVFTGAGKDTLPLHRRKQNNGECQSKSGSCTNERGGGKNLGLFGFNRGL